VHSSPYYTQGLALPPPIDPAAGQLGEEACRQKKKKRKSGWGAGGGAVGRKGGGVDWGSMTRVRVAAEFEVRVNGVLLQQRFHWDTGVSFTTSFTTTARGCATST
jgi:hypothetical protein